MIRHGCPEHYNDQSVLPNGLTAAKTRERDAARLDFLRTQASAVEIVWECQINKQKDADPEMAKCFAVFEDEGFF